jgi:integrase
MPRLQDKSPMTGAAPTTENRTLRRLPNASYRQREYLTEAEVERLIDAARKRGRNGPRDAAAILLAYRHGLRAAELCQLRWAQVDLRHGRLHVQSSEGWLRQRPSPARPRASCAAAATWIRALCVRDRSGHTNHHGLVPANGAANRPSGEATIPGASAHATAFDGL